MAFIISSLPLSVHSNQRLWIGISEETNSLNSNENWSPPELPGSSDTAEFDTYLPVFNPLPTANAQNFSVSSIFFDNLADSFTFNFNDCTLTLTGEGITGLNSTNTLIIATNSNNETAITGQILFTNTGSASSGEASLQVINLGTISGSVAEVVTSVQSTNQIGFGVNEPFSIGNFATWDVSNTGIDTTTGSGGNQIGYITDAQIGFTGTFSAGTDATITLSNTGMDSSAGSDSFIGWVGGQLTVSGPFNADNNLTLSATNSGTYQGTGSGNDSVAYVNSNQLEFISTFTVGEEATLTVLNEGVQEGSGSGNQVGTISNYQLWFQQDLSAGNNFTLNVTNKGSDTTTGPNPSNVGIVDNACVEIDGALSIGDTASITIYNEGTTSSASTGSSIGTVVSQMLLIEGDLIGGNGATFSMTNIGTDHSTGSGSNNIGIIGLPQMEVVGEIILSDSASFLFSNTGENSGPGSNNMIGIIEGSQFSPGDLLFQAGDNFILSCTNAATDTTSGSGNNQVGCIQADQFSNDNYFIIGDGATLSFSNIGTNESNGAGNSTGYIQGSQCAIIDPFQAGNSLTINVTNIGVDRTNNASTPNSIGVVAGSQLSFGNSFIAIDGATITVSNSGTNKTSSSDSVGSISGDQFVVTGSFSAGNNLTINVSNTASTLVGNSSVGTIESQVVFIDSFTTGDGSIITALNNGSGTVSGSQILFQNGFTLTSGSAILQAINEGTLIGHGIYIQGDSPGGDLAVFLENNSFLVETTSPGFMIGSLSGNSNTTAEFNVPLTINTDAGVNASFAGTLSGNISILKTGTGSQTLSGTNTFTGPLNVDGGTLIFNGYTPGGVSVSASAVLKGNGVFEGAAFIEGVISPGQSIGILSMGSFTNNGGIYELEVDSSGDSDLILVLGPAIINGGSIHVTTLDGGYAYGKLYTILKATSVTGTYSELTGTNHYPLVSSTILYDAEHVYLNFEANILPAAKTYNQRAVANQLDGIAEPNAVQTDILNQIAMLSVAKASKSLSSASGWQYTNDFFVAETVNQEFIKRLYDPLRGLVTEGGSSVCNGLCTDKRCSDDVTAWLESGGSHMHLNGNRNAYTVTLNGWEITTGIQKTFLCDWTLGTAGSFEHDHIDYKNYGGSGGSDTWLIGLYALYRPSYFYALMNCTYGYSFNTMKRSIHIGPHHFTGHSHPRLSQFTFYGEIGPDWFKGPIRIQQFLGIQTGSYWYKGANENFAGGWGLNVESSKHALLSSRVGFHITSNKIPKRFSMSLDLAWDKQYFSQKNTIQEQFAEFGRSFAVRGVYLGSNSFDYALTLAKCINNNLRIYAKGSGQVWNQAYQTSVLGGADFSW